MRKLIVSNFVTLDGLYEGRDKNIISLYDYYHDDYHGDNSFDFYNAELLRAADFLLLSRNAFLGNREYWTAVPNDPEATDIRREIAGLFNSIEKLMITDKLSSEDLAPWVINTKADIILVNGYRYGGGGSPDLLDVELSGEPSLRFDSDSLGGAFGARSALAWVHRRSALRAAGYCVIVQWPGRSPCPAVTAEDQRFPGFPFSLPSDA